MEKDNIKKWPIQALKYIVDLISGPTVSAILTNYAIKDPSEYLTGFIYLLGFALSALKLSISVKQRKIEFLEKMVYRKQDKDGEKLEGGIVDSNSVGMAEWVSKI